MATDIATRELRKPIDVAEYLFRRLYEVGIRSVHGVPGERSSPIGSHPFKNLALTMPLQVTITSLLWTICQNVVFTG
jgi:hypothetical protein